MCQGGRKRENKDEIEVNKRWVSHETGSGKFLIVIHLFFYFAQRKSFGFIWLASSEIFLSIINISLFMLS